MAASMGMGLFLAAVMVVVLLVAGKERQEVFLVIGDLDGWRLPGVGLALGLMVVTYFFFDYHLPSRAVITNALPLLLPALVFAGLLALNEEIMFRATLLSSLHGAVGDNQAVMMTVFVFGMAHYLGGTPANASGAVVTGALGWLWATIMLETGGIFLSWFIHFMNNVPTVVFWALSASSTTTPGPTD
jgi:membrane protease YdiL (CAAX protease family)